MNEAEKMVISLYPENLKGLDLSFDESIYAIAFGLQDEIREYGKEAVFNQLGMSAEKMHERVEYCLGKKMYDGYANALRLVLNGNNAAHVDVERLAETFTFAVSNLCQPTDASIDYCSYRADVNYRHLLKVYKYGHICLPTQSLIFILLWHTCPKSVIRQSENYSMLLIRLKKKK